MSLRTQLNQRRADKIPAGWMDGDTLAKKEGYSCREAARNVVTGALKAGLLETKKFRVIWGDGLRLRPYYRYTNKT